MVRSSGRDDVVAEWAPERRSGACDDPQVPTVNYCGCFQRWRTSLVCDPAPASDPAILSTGPPDRVARVVGRDREPHGAQAPGPAALRSHARSGPVPSPSTPPSEHRRGGDPRDPTDPSGPRSDDRPGRYDPPRLPDPRDPSTPRGPTSRVRRCARHGRERTPRPGAARGLRRLAGPALPFHNVVTERAVDRGADQRARRPRTHPRTDRGPSDQPVERATFRRSGPRRARRRVLGRRRRRPRGRGDR